MVRECTRRSSCPMVPFSCLRNLRLTRMNVYLAGKVSKAAGLAGTLETLHQQFSQPDVIEKRKTLNLPDCVRFLELKMWALDGEYIGRWLSSLETLYVADLGNQYELGLVSVLVDYKSCEDMTKVLFGGGQHDGDNIRLKWTCKIGAADRRLAHGSKLRSAVSSPLYSNPNHIGWCDVTSCETLQKIKCLPKTMR